MEQLTNRTYDEITIGEHATYSRTVTEDTLVLFATACGDVNPVHFDDEYAANSPFKQRIVHGMWSGAVISSALANVLPGPGSVYLGQTLKFNRPVNIGDTLTIELTVTEKHEKLNRIVLNCIGKNQHGKTVLEGTAEVMAPKEKIVVAKPILPSVTINR